MADAIALLTADPPRCSASRPARWPRARRPICACSTRSASGRSRPASCPARRRTRRSTAARWKAACSAPGKPAGGCSDDHDLYPHRRLWLPAGLDPVRPAAHPRGRAGRHPRHRLGQYRRHQRAAHRQARAWPPRRCCWTAPRARRRCCWRAPMAAGWRRCGPASAPCSAICSRSGSASSGGKGVATGFGVLIAAAWPVGLLAGAIWLVDGDAAALSSAAALLASAAGAGAGAGCSPAARRRCWRWPSPCWSSARHHANIRRLLAGPSRASAAAERMTRRRDDAVDRLRLARTEGVGPVTYRRLLRRYGSRRRGARRAAGARPRRRARDRAAALRRALGRRAREMRAAGAAWAAHLRFVDTDAYPAAAGAARGRAAGDRRAGRRARCWTRRRSRWSAARNASANGQRMAETLAADLAAAGLVVVSGLARGDRRRRASRRAARPGGPSRWSPAGSTAPTRPKTPICSAASPKAARWWPRRRSAPRRSRATFPGATASSPASSLGVVVVEAAPRSGSLITARLAQEAGRELFAVPGSPLDPRARGANDLLRQGAHLTESAADVLDNLPDHPAARGSAAPRCSRAAAPASPSRRQPHGRRRRPSSPCAQAQILELLIFRPPPC